MFWSQAEWLTRKVLHRPRKERVTKLAFLLGDLRFSPRPGAHKAWGNGKWGAATACGEGSSLFCPERAVLKARPVLQLSDTVSELSWHFRPLHLQALIAIVCHLPWLHGRRDECSFHRYKHKVPRRAPLNKVTSHPAPASPKGGRGCTPCSPAPCSCSSITHPQPAPAATSLGRANICTREQHSVLQPALQSCCCLTW